MSVGAEIDAFLRQLAAGEAIRGGGPPPESLYERPVVSNTGLRIQPAEPTATACQLLERWGSIGWWLQAFLGLVCLVSLVGKRFTDTFRRPWKVWFFDTSKQGVQAFLNHLINLWLSMAFGELLYDAHADPCNWYCINLALDCTLGVAILFCLLRVLQCAYRLRCVDRPELARSGEYGDPPHTWTFGRQLLDWEGLVIVQKLAMAAFVINFRAELARVADLLLGWLSPYPHAKIIIEMVVAPLALNVFALWTADSFLQADPRKSNGFEVQANTYPSIGMIVGQMGVSSQSTNGKDAAQPDDESDRIVSFQEWKKSEYSTRPKRARGNK